MDDADLGKGWGRDWDGRATSSLAADAASSTSERVERAESGVAKKSKMQQKYLNVTSDDLWCIRDKLAGKKSSLGKTYETNSEANDKVHELNQQSSKYVETLALLYANFERNCAEKEVEEQFDRDFDESLKMLSEIRFLCIIVAATYVRIEDDWNEGLKVNRDHFQETATATLALICGKKVRPGSQRGPLPAGNLGHGGLFAGQGYARRRLRGGRDREVSGVMNEGWILCDNSVRQGELLQDEQVEMG